MSLDDDARDELRRLAAEHRLRVPRVVDGPQAPRVVLDGAPVVNLASNDYLSLAGDPRLARAVATAAAEDGFGAGASRLIVGNHRRHAVLEAALGDWLRRDGVQVFGTGFAANLGVLGAIAGAGDVVFSDALNHASIIDGCRLSRARIVVYPHRDTAALEAALGEHAGRRRIVVSESLFSMDGDVADVEALAAICRRHDAALVLDEAHAIGVWGPEGRGVAAAVGVVPDVLVGTCGKALGGFGAFVATTRAVADLLWNRARSLVFSTALPPMIAAGVTAAIGIVRGAEGDERRRTLGTHVRRLRERIPAAGGAPDSAIAPILVGDDARAMQLSAHLLARGIYAQGIRPPTVPAGTSRLRVSLCAGLADVDMERATNELHDAVQRWV